MSKQRRCKTCLATLKWSETQFCARCNSRFKRNVARRMMRRSMERFGMMTTGSVVVDTVLKELK